MSNMTTAPCQYCGKLIDVPRPSYLPGFSHPCYDCGNQKIYDTPRIIGERPATAEEMESV